MLAEDGVTLVIAVRRSRDLPGLLPVGEKQRLEGNLALKVNSVHVLAPFFLWVRRRGDGSSGRGAAEGKKPRPFPLWAGSRRLTAYSPSRGFGRARSTQNASPAPN